MFLPASLTLFRALAFAFLLALGQGVFASTQCQEVFSSHFNDTIKALAELRIDIDLAQAQGKSSVERSMLAANYASKEMRLADYLAQNKIMSPVKLRSRITLEILKLQKDLKSQKKAQLKADAIKDIPIDGTQFVFHLIKPGSFEMSPRKASDKEVDVTITKPFEMMSTVTTQVLWEKVAEIFYDRFPPDKERSPLLPDTFLYPTPKPWGNLKGDRLPVVNISPQNIDDWIIVLNILSRQSDPALYFLIPNHKSGDIYRLPTDAEWEFVARGRGKHKGIFHFGNDSKNLAQYAWYGKNSEQELQAVAQKKPLVIDGAPFFDLHGNVWEVVADNYVDFTPPGGKDPLVKGTFNNSYYRAMRGGAYSHMDFHAETSFRTYRIVDNDAARDVGFRLVREVQP